tara:strand:- start:229 stop:876 length:648 start_codon:yes stop_codon:yes gene_type:complete
MMNAQPEAIFIDPATAQWEQNKQRLASEAHQRAVLAASKEAQGDSQWFVLSVANRHEMAVAEAMQVENICAWVPTRQAAARRCRGRLMDGHDAPIFAGYVFVKVVMSAPAWQGLLGFDKVISLLGDGERPLAVSAEIINALKGMVASKLFDKSPRDQMEAEYVKGCKVEVTGGAFAFVNAVVTGYRGTRHVRCKTALFGGEVAVTIPVANLKIID